MKWVGMSIGVAFGLAAHSSSAVPQTADSKLDVTPITPPTLSYPVLADIFGISGYCEVRFSVDERGLPFNILPQCTSNLFCYEAKKSISEAVFKPAYDNGIPRVRHKLVYPLRFTPYGVDPDSLNRSSLKPCQKIPIS